MANLNNQRINFEKILERVINQALQRNLTKTTEIIVKQRLLHLYKTGSTK